MQEEYLYVPYRIKDNNRFFSTIIMGNVYETRAIAESHCKKGWAVKRVKVVRGGI